jgi:hypothetical protein
MILEQGFLNFARFALVCILDMPGGVKLNEDMLEARDIVLCIPSTK